jgi:hypothetical protein
LHMRLQDPEIYRKELRKMHVNTKHRQRAG